jgi:hypothetical protein
MDRGLIYWPNHAGETWLSKPEEEEEEEKKMSCFIVRVASVVFLVIFAHSFHQFK